MPSDTEDRLVARSAVAGISQIEPLLDRLVIYFDLLQRWNRTINLTSLEDPDEAIDRLILEPLAAAPALPHSPRLIDVGSGGGSPAIPLALALSTPLLVMVESRTRKSAFLREAMRVLELEGTVENARFEEVARRQEYREAMDLVSIRAVRVDPPVLSVASSFLSLSGRIALFENAKAELPALPPQLVLTGRTPLLTRSRLALLGRSDVPRGT